MKISILFTIILIIGLFFFSFAHEEVHRIIYADYGIKSEFKIIFPHFATVTEPFPASQCPNECLLANEINEAINYSLMPFFVVVGIGIIFIIINLEEKRFNKDISRKIHFTKQ